jgi:hypothetical protein
MCCQKLLLKLFLKEKVSTYAHRVVPPAMLIFSQHCNENLRGLHICCVVSSLVSLVFKIGKRALHVHRQKHKLCNRARLSFLKCSSRTMMFQKMAYTICHVVCCSPAPLCSVSISKEFAWLFMSKIAADSLMCESPKYLTHRYMWDLSARRCHSHLSLRDTKITKKELGLRYLLSLLLSCLILFSSML